ncbi:hypothetical protein D9M71_509200 [compost metagenome]
MTSVRNGFEHETKRWTLNVKWMQLQVGMNPKPITVINLEQELPNHRFILSDVPPLWSEEKYINRTDLPTTYP